MGMWNILESNKIPSINPDGKVQTYEKIINWNHVRSKPLRLGQNEPSVMTFQFNC